MLGPDHLESTILKITGKISVVIHSLLFMSVHGQKQAKYPLFSDITSCYLKISSCRWLKENNRLLFSTTGIDDQGLYRHIKGPIITLMADFCTIPDKWKTSDYVTVLTEICLHRLNLKMISIEAVICFIWKVFWHTNIISIRKRVLTPILKIL